MTQNALSLKVLLQTKVDEFITHAKNEYPSLIFPDQLFQVAGDAAWQEIQNEVPEINQI
jgi:hypothetical protein